MLKIAKIDYFWQISKISKIENNLKIDEFQQIRKFETIQKFRKSQIFFNNFENRKFLKPRHFQKLSTSGKFRRLGILRLFRNLQKILESRTF